MSSAVRKNLGISWGSKSAQRLGDLFKQRAIQMLERRGALPELIAEITAKTNTWVLVYDEMERQGQLKAVKRGRSFGYAKALPESVDAAIVIVEGCVTDEDRNRF